MVNNDDINKKFSERSRTLKNDVENLNTEKNSSDNKVHVIVGLDFGTTFSGFAYCHATEKNSPYSNDLWHGEVGQLKTNTVLRYDDEYNNVSSWGAPALVKKLNRRKKNQISKENKPVELFKLHLGDIMDKFKPKLPVEYKKAITDYLREIGKVIKEMVATRWSNVDYFENVLLVLSVPAEFSEKSKAIMRICAYNASLIKEECSKNLQFTTEPVYCMENSLREHALDQPGTNFMVVDCGGGTVDLTIRKLINDKQLGEVTERAGDFCGSSFIDAEFIKYLRKLVGDKPMDSLVENHYGRMQYMIQQFCISGKLRFTGDDPNFQYVLDIQETIPELKQYITDENIIKALDDWVVEIDFETMKLIFEPVIQKILLMIKAQLDNAQETCSAMFLVGGFSESKYLQKRIKEEFLNRVKDISVPIQPMAAIARGAAIYGLSIRSNNLNNLGNDDDLKCVIVSRVLKYTYGIKTTTKWEKGDPIHRKTRDGFIESFHCLARRGTRMDINQEITCSRLPIHPDQTTMVHHLYCTSEYDAEYCDDPGMKLLGKLHIELPGSGLDRPVLFGMTFGKMEITATSKNKLTGQSYKATFKLNLDDKII
ncbi:14377_t:CDS:2 [Funneliformis caledonium]|uniref:14377_t:CDS:1 n=1 Tax=Funneliformis caledonium TaxID=1117310 RepID=A0A9N9BY24_9GLOM|nr:14377_t:CDS:2 [Funneliformis caledonium]